MKMELIKHNLGLKILALSLAVLISVVVNFSNFKEGDFPGEIPVNVKNLPEGMVAIFDVRSVKLKIWAEKERWQKITSDTFLAEIDLSGLKEGTYELPVKVGSTLPEVSIRSIEPNRILVRIEPVEQKEVPVVLKISGSLESNWDLDSTKISPKKVFVKGPKSEIASLGEATALLEISSETTEIKKEVDLVGLKPDGSHFNNLVFVPAKVLVELSPSSSALIKTVGVKPDIIDKLPAGFYINSISTNPTFVVIKGPKELVSGIKYLTTEKISLTSGNNFTGNVSLVLPEGVELESPGKIKLTVEIAKTAIQKEITSNPEFILGEGLKATSSPQLVNAVLSIENPENAQVFSVRLVLNLKEKPAGDYTIPLEEKMFSLSPGIKLLSFSPKELKISITAKQ